MARLQEHYRNNVVKQLQEQFGYANVMQVPAITKITLNMGVGEAIEIGPAEPGPRAFCRASVV